uniref:Large ribosomal subunit protein bL32c n=1 Tax=Nitella hyalina TaxID=181804 RepID=A0A2H4G6R2_NITHY|nr:ribosomal protein L32 [Nitella hyalina]APP89507.1 ribosomal protein L32 [Nitella hyalina]WKT08482.1 ribosomal protein L32 [Nitella hyalina]
MAVPKKRTSKSKKKIRKTTWKKEAYQVAIKAFSLAKSVLSGRSKSFRYSQKNGMSSTFLQSESNKEL